jgi:hypothetical protein
MAVAKWGITKYHTSKSINKNGDSFVERSSSLVTPLLMVTGNTGEVHRLGDDRLLFLHFLFS